MMIQNLYIGMFFHIMKWIIPVIVFIMLSTAAGTNLIIKNSDNSFKNNEIIDSNGQRTFIFPIGTKINVTVEDKRIEEENISWLSEKQEYFINEPSYHIGVGLKNGKHVLFLTIYSNKSKVSIDYKSPLKTASINAYDLLIITPEKFSRAFERLAKFKEEHGIKTIVATLESIYKSTQGRDDAEKIKYYIKDSVENYGIKYVLLGGSIYKLPIRYVTYYEEYRWKCYSFKMPTDLYYADLYRYDNGIKFSSWDTNNNGIYGEVYYGCNGINDTIDLYPDVYVGRLACNNLVEANVVVNKIIKYEENAYNKNWFNRIILVGGDTFPGNGIIEGEFMNDYIANIMKAFESERLWASYGNLNAVNIEAKIGKGAGFLYFSGHGFPYGWGTHKPDDKNWTGTYFTPYIAGLINGYKLPVIFLDACLTAKLDFNSSDLREDGVPVPINATFPCFAWYFIAQPTGGAIATIGSTRVAFTGVDENGPHWGSGFLAYHFFSSYMNSSDKILGNIFANAQECYLNSEWDRWTIQEFILLGDPSLKIGGYE